MNYYSSDGTEWGNRSVDLGDVFLVDRKSVSDDGPRPFVFGPYVGAQGRPVWISECVQCDIDFAGALVVLVGDC